MLDLARRRIPAARALVAARPVQGSALNDPSLGSMKYAPTSIWGESRGSKLPTNQPDLSLDAIAGLYVRNLLKSGPPTHYKS